VFGGDFGTIVKYFEKKSRLPFTSPVRRFQSFS
jgi:hypothetical protein